MALKNVTITAEARVLEWARIEAAKKNTSVSRMVGEMLTEKMQHDDAYEIAMQEALKFKPLLFNGPFLSRDEIYAERLDRFR